MAARKPVKKAVKKTVKRAPGKVPLTKAGKPDKRFTKSIGAPSRTTKKAPSKRLKARRAKPKVAGYSANPVSRPPVYVVVVTVEGRVLFLSSIKRAGAATLPFVFDDLPNKAMPFSPRSSAQAIATLVSHMTGKTARVMTIGGKGAKKK